MAFQKMLMIILATGLATTLGQTFLNDDYSYRQVLTACLGEDLFFGLLKTFNDVMLECSQEVVEPEEAPPLDYPALFDTLVRNGLRPQPLPVAQPSLSPVTFSQFVPTTFHLAAVAVTDRLSNFTCALDKLEFIDDDFEIQYEKLKEDLDNFRIDQELKEDLKNIIDFCKDLVECMPEPLVPTVLSPKLRRIIGFHRCAREMRYQACVKHDYRQRLTQYDLTELPVVDGVEPLDMLVSVMNFAENANDFLLY
ncbi:uncharacterized protein LOC122245217 [Penaeus japonicus]|uniref:uncharacterized protein LOC122245217 n=1 Tax=Penaeus japonicus TaxID=27405 RepID=UPI001C711C01|nr:uncharacterized protein LOC122245217 [Penaeus japonicus]